MINSPQTLSVIDPTEGLVQYVQYIKPYHTKILEVLVEYVYTDPIIITVRDKWSSQSNFSNLPLSNLYTATSITDQLMFGIHLDLYDTISPTIADIRPVGYGVDLFSTGSDGTFGAATFLDGLAITAVGSGTDSTYTLMPDGFDSQAFDE